MTQRLEAEGLQNPKSEYKWDDGSDHDDVTKIYVHGEREGIKFIKFDYINKGQPKDGSFHGHSYSGFTKTFEINHLKNEHLESVEGYYNPNSKVIEGLQFKTNLRISEMMGYEEYVDKKFALAVDGKKIIGFHGSAGEYVNSLGAYFTMITPTKMEVKGGKGGNEWDDGAGYEAVTKVHAKCGLNGMQDIKCDYLDKDGHLEEGPDHGSTQDRGFTLEPFEIDHPNDEYLLSVDGYYDDTSGVTKTLRFKTNMNTKLMGLDETGTKFSLSVHGMKIIGFHGYAHNNLNSLGAYFTSLPLKKLEYAGNPGGCLWDDGSYQGVRKVYVYNDEYVRCIRFEYDNCGKVEGGPHGPKVEVAVQEGEFVLDYPNEFITSVEGTSKKIVNTDHTRLITSLTFKTSKGRTSPTFGNGFGIDLVPFLLESKGCAFVGFHGRCSSWGLHGLGAYTYPMPAIHDEEQLE